MEQLAFRRLSTGSVYKIVFYGSWIGSVPIFFVLSLFAAGGAEIMSWNGRYITGISALFTGPLLGLFMATIFAALVGSMTALGLWIYSKFKTLTLFVSLEPDEQAPHSP